jgi:spore germination cell wall hydrolase CwlJ-like protein
MAATIAAVLATGYFVRDIASAINAAFAKPHVTTIAWSSGEAPRPLNLDALFNGRKGARADASVVALPPVVVTGSMTPFRFADTPPAQNMLVNRALKGARATETASDISAPAVSDRESAGVLFVSAYASEGMMAAAESPADEQQTAAAVKDQKAPEGSGWLSLMRNARVRPDDATLFGGLSETEFRNKELHCMATAVYFEARGEPERGQQAVAQVVMNRVRSPYYPKTICGVVYQGSFNRTGCQFSFTCDGIPDRATNKEQWEASMRVAKQVIERKVWVDEIGYATHYHATYVNPKWKTLVRRITQIGVHIFYLAPFADPQIAYTKSAPAS